MREEVLEALAAQRAGTATDALVTDSGFRFASLEVGTRSTSAPWGYAALTLDTAICVAFAVQVVDLAQANAGDVIASVCLAAGRAGSGGRVCSCFQPAAQLPAG